MPKLIKTIHDRVNFAMKKGLSGYISPDRITEEVYAEVMNLWRKYIPEYAATRQVGLYLKPFEAREVISTLGGPTNEGTKQVTSCHKYPLEAFVTASGKTVDILTIGEYRNRFNHPHKGPSVDYPILKFEKDTVYVAPKVDITVIHLKTPTKSVFAYTVSGDDYVYDDGNSVDLEFDQVVHDDIVNRVLANLGISMRDADPVNYSNQQKAQENV